ncbi:MAG: hypothetical protein LC772_01805 [Chloroflexi bacterium]|nr:hypothetical protein [Chloroflexota bacterium]
MSYTLTAPTGRSVPLAPIVNPTTNHHAAIRNLLGNPLKALLDRPMVTGAWGNITPGPDFLRDGALPLGTVFGGNTGLMGYLLNGNHPGLTAQTPVRCILGLNLQVDAGGWTNVGAFINGKPPGAYGANQVNIGLM